MEHIKDIIHRIKYKFSYAYRTRCGHGISVIRSEKDLKAIVDFCRQELEDKEMMDLNPDRKKIYEMTVKLYEQNQSDEREVYTKLHPFTSVHQEQYNDVEDFIDDHVRWYWN